MRQYIIFTRVFLILSIFNFARAAPALVREVQKIRVDVDIDEDGRAKRWEPSAHWLTNAADPSRAPTIPARGLQYYHWYGDYPPTDPSLDYSVSSPSESSTESPSNSPSTDHSPPSSPSTDRLPSGSSSTSHTSVSIDYSPPSSWSTDDPLPPALPQTPSYSPNSRLADDSHSRSSSPGYSPEPPRSSWSTDNSPQSSSSTDHSLFSIDYSPPSSWSTDNLPPQPLTPTPESLTGPHQSTDSHPPPSLRPPNPAESVSEPTSEDFLDNLLKGKIRRHISGFDAVNLAWREV